MKHWLPYRDKNKWGFLSGADGIGCEPRFDDCMPFADGFGHATMNKGIYILDEDFNTTAIVPGYISYTVFSDGVLLIESRETGRQSFVYPDGTRRILSEFDNALPFSGHRAFVQQGGLWGMISPNGDWVVEPRFECAASFGDREDVTSVKLERSGWRLINKQGEFTSSREFEFLRVASEGVVPFGATVHDHVKFGLADLAGETLFEPTFDELEDRINAGYMGVENSNGLWGVVDRTANWLIEPKYSYIGECRKGLFLAYQGGQRNQDRILEHGKFGYVDSAGSVRIDFDFDVAWPFEHGIAKVEWFVDPESGKYETAFGYIRENGVMLWSEARRESNSGR